MSKENIKNSLYKACQNYIDERIQHIETAIESARESVKSDDKSSAGDKYETSRSIMQSDQERLGGQLTATLKLRELLNKVGETEHTEVADVGSLLITNRGKYYIAIGIGKIEIDGETYFIVSPTAPIAVEFMGHRAGDTINFNNQEFIIREVI